jgi:hypothetical protein
MGPIQSTEGKIATRSDGAFPALRWCIAGLLIAVTSAMIGLQWDISWHRSVGRDTLWTPAHFPFHACALLAAFCPIALILHTTFRGTPEARAASVSIWKLQAPLGAFLSLWGGIAMLTVPIFDGYWHDAYGLGLKILSAPHLLLAAGILSIELGTLFLVLGSRNRAEQKSRARMELMFLYIGAMLLVAVLVLAPRALANNVLEPQWYSSMEYLYRVYLHSARFYLVISALVPMMLFAIATASSRRWAATIVAGIYTIFLLSLVWILPLFPAEPKLWPIYQNVTRYVPPEFPLLLVIPAFGIDLVRWKWRDRSRALYTAAAGAAFLLIFLALQWPFSTYLMSPAARNWFFGTDHFDYNLSPLSYYSRYQFFALEKTHATFWLELAAALGAAMVAARLGDACGRWMRQVRR